MKTYDLEDTGRGGYEPHYQLVESVNHKKEPDGQGEWVRREDADAVAADLLATDKERENLFGFNQRQRARIRALEAALRNLNDTVKSMRNPQTLADVALLLFKFNGPVFVADQLLGSVAETEGE